MSSLPHASRYLAAAIAIAAFVGEVAQIGAAWPKLLSLGYSIPAIASKLLSYFTILTNAGAVVIFGAVALAPHANVSRHLHLKGHLSGWTLHLLLVGVIYQALLAALWQPTGIQALADHLLHHVTPILATLYWLLFLSRQALPWSCVGIWFLYPTFYAIWVFLRGAWTNDYPYPFLNPTKIPAAKAVLGALVVGSIFPITGSLMVAIGRFRASRHSTSSSA